jgi:ABC-2 type transport system permease protein
MAYVVMAVFLALSGTFFSLYLSGTNYFDTSIVGFVQPGSILLLLFCAVLTMRLLAEERKLGTLELLLTAPVRDAEIVLGKFLASLGILLLVLTLTLYYTLLLAVFGDPDLGPIGTGYLGLVLLGAAALAIGIFASSLTANQILAAVLAGGILFGLWFVGSAARFVPEAPGKVLAFVSLSYHFTDFTRGVIDTRGIVYFANVTALFLFLATRSLETRRWR